MIYEEAIAVLDNLHARNPEVARVVLESWLEAGNPAEHCAAVNWRADGAHHRGTVPGSMSSAD